MFKVIGFNGKDVWIQNLETLEVLRIYRIEVRKLLDRGIIVEGARKHGKDVTLKVPDKPAAVKAKILLRDANVVKDGILTGLSFWQSLADKNGRVRISSYCGVVPFEVMKSAIVNSSITLVIDDNVYIDGKSLVIKMISCFVDMSAVSDVNIKRIYSEMFSESVNMIRTITSHLIDNEERRILFEGLTWLCWFGDDGEKYKDYLGSNMLVKSLICRAIDDLYLDKTYRFEEARGRLLSFETYNFINKDVCYYLNPIVNIIRILRYFKCSSFSDDVLVRYKSKIYSLIS